MRPLLGLVMIVKDEAQSIVATLNSVVGVVDHVTILDTGSTDGTATLAAGFCADREFPGLVRSEPFIPYEGIADRRVIDFSATRNRALALHESREDPPVFSLFLSGDELLEGGEALRAYLEAQRDAADGAYRVQLRTGTSRWLFPRVLRTDAKWRYKNPIHESPVGPSGETGGETIPGVTIHYSAPDQARLHKRMREVDLPILEQMAAIVPQTHEEHASRAHALAQLGQTHENLALEYPAAPGSARTTHQMAAMSYYWRRGELGGDPDDCNYSLFKFYAVADELGIYTHAELLERLKPLSEIDPNRPEVRYMLAAHSAAIKPGLALPLALEAAKVAREAKKNAPHLPVDDRCEWLSLRVAAACAQSLGLTARARDLAKQGLAAGGPKEAFAEFGA